jgi:hypothetical protein
MLEEVINFGGLSCDGLNFRLSSLFSDLLASHEAKGTSSHSKVCKKGVREINGLFSSIHYDTRSGMFLVAGARGGLKEFPHESQADFLEC